MSSVLSSLDRTKRFLHVLAVGAIAISSPLFGVLAAEPQFWVARRATYLEFAALVLAVGMVSFALAITGLLSSIIHGRFGDVMHVTLITLLFGIAVLPLVNRVLSSSVPPAAALAVSAAVGVGLTLVYLKVETVRWVMTYLAGAHVVLALWLLVTAPGLGNGSTPKVNWTADSDMNVVMVVFDELSAPTLAGSGDAVDSERFPNFARLAETAVSYPNAYTVSDSSVMAIPTLLTGSFPRNGRYGTIADYPLNLFTLLGQTHEMNVQEGLTKLCPSDSCGSDSTLRAEVGTLLEDAAVIYLHTMLPESLAGGLPSIGVAWEGFIVGSAESIDTSSLGEAGRYLANLTSGEARAVDFGRFLDSLASARTPTLHYAHVELPHPPWEYFPDGRRYAFSDWIGGLRPDGSWADDELQSLQGYQRYDLQLQFTDVLLGMLLDTLEDSGSEENTLLVVTSDHGVNFQPKEPRRTATSASVGSLAPIPLFIRYPGLEGGRADDRSTLSVDILPTILDFMGSEELPQLDGRSLLSDDPSWDSDFELEIGLATVSVADLSRKAQDDAKWLRATRERMDRSGWLYAGPDGFFGARVSDFVISGETGEISLVWPGLHNRPMVAGYLATNVRARLNLGETRDRGLFALAINGTIWDVTSPDGEALNFVVPLEAYEDDANRLDIYGVDTSGGQTILIEYS